MVTNQITTEPQEIYKDEKIGDKGMSKDIQVKEDKVVLEMDSEDNLEDTKIDNIEENNKKSSIILKQKQVSEIVEQINKAKTFMIVSIKGLPSKQFQAIKKSIREEASVKVAKKNIMLRAIKEVGKDSILPLKDYIKADSSFIISNKEGYELAGILSKKKTPVFAKAGQIAPENIEVKAGPTDLVPGPAISELGSLGIQIAVENGKISIKADKIVVNKNQEIKEEAAALFQKLNIQPFSVGLNPVVIYDIENEKIYTDIKIDSKETVGELISSASKALRFAQKIIYYCKETIGHFLGKAKVEGDSLEKLSPSEEKVEEEKGNSERDKEESGSQGSKSNQAEGENQSSEDLSNTNNVAEETGEAGSGVGGDKIMSRSELNNVKEGIKGAEEE